MNHTQFTPIEILPRIWRPGSPTLSLGGSNVETNAEKFLDLDDRSPSVQTHLGIIQGVIQRMAANSASCKTWCITIVAAIVVVVADKDKPSLGWLAVLPILVFAILDVYYLALEKGFVAAYNAFIQKLHNRTLAHSDLYSLTPTGYTTERQVEALKSFSVWGFYLPLLVLALLTVVLSSG